MCPSSPLISGKLAVAWGLLLVASVVPAPGSEPQVDQDGVRKFVSQHCVECHNRDDKRAGLALDALNAEDVAAHPQTWERVVRKLAARQMPPAGKPRPDERTYDAVVAGLE